MFEFDDYYYKVMLLSGMLIIDILFNVYIKV